jgi:CRP-like cAMP-binding protein
MKATKNTRLLLINEENFHQLLKQYPFLAEQIIQEFCNRQDMIQSYKQQLEDMGLLNNEEVNNPLLWVTKYFQQMFVTK